MEKNQLSTMYFSDETQEYRRPSEPNPGDWVTVRLRVPRGGADTVQLVLSDRPAPIAARKECEDELFEYYSASFVCGNEAIAYRFAVKDGPETVIIQKTRTTRVRESTEIDLMMDFRFVPGFHVPQWAKGSVQYQIFTDRFYRGDPTNDVTDAEYWYLNSPVRHISDWSCPPDLTDPRCFYGGDLEGVRRKLDYLQSLGIETIYFNPIFVSPSSHKYDTQDYEHIDPHFGRIVIDGGNPISAEEKDNRCAEKYRVRTTDERNLEASDQLFAQLCSEIHARGMRVILDGVFNHCGSMNRWMDRDGLYGGGAWQNPNSKTREYFYFSEKNGADAYKGWWDYETLPKLNYDESEALSERILSIAEKWARPPYAIDGWRLDVAADLGMTPEVNHRFWKAFRKRIKSVSPEILILAEHYGDAGEWLRGDEWDTVMNYDAFMDPVSSFFTGMEKHSDRRDEKIYRNGKAFFETITREMARMGTPSILCAMNELSNHDHSRFLTRTNRKAGRTQTLGPEAAGEGISKALFRTAVVFQFTWPGSPTVYYGDEAGVVGWTDPDNRRTYPWGHEDAQLIEFHRSMIRIRREHPILKTGSLIPLYADEGAIVYARFDRRHCAIIAINTSDSAIVMRPDLRPAGVKDDMALKTLLMSDDIACTFGNTRFAKTHIARDGTIQLSMPSTSAVILYGEIE